MNAALFFLFIIVLFLNTDQESVGILKDTFIYLNNDYKKGGNIDDEMDDCNLDFKAF